MAHQFDRPSSYQRDYQGPPIIYARADEKPLPVQPETDDAGGYDNARQLSQAMLLSPLDQGNRRKIPRLPSKAKRQLSGIPRASTAALPHIVNDTMQQHENTSQYMHSEGLPPTRPSTTSEWSQNSYSSDWNTPNARPYRDAAIGHYYNPSHDFNINQNPPVSMEEQYTKADPSQGYNSQWSHMPAPPQRAATAMASLQSGPHYNQNGACDGPRDSYYGQSAAAQMEPVSDQRFVSESASFAAAYQRSTRAEYHYPGCPQGLRGRIERDQNCSCTLETFDVYSTRPKVFNNDPAELTYYLK